MSAHLHPRVRRGGERKGMNRWMEWDEEKKGKSSVMISGVACHFMEIKLRQIELSAAWQFAFRPDRPKHGPRKGLNSLKHLVYFQIGLKWTSSCRIPRFPIINCTTFKDGMVMGVRNGVRAVAIIILSINMIPVLSSFGRQALCNT